MMELYNTLAKIHTALLAAGFVLLKSKSEALSSTSESRTWTGTAILHTNGHGGIRNAKAGLAVTVDEIHIHVDVDVTGTETWNICVGHDCKEEGFVLYTDEGIEKDVSKLLNSDVRFTEQSFQDMYMLHMELVSR